MLFPYGRRSTPSSAPASEDYCSTSSSPILSEDSSWYLVDNSSDEDVSTSSSYISAVEMDTEDECDSELSSWSEVSMDATQYGRDEYQQTGASSLQSGPAKVEQNKRKFEELDTDTDSENDDPEQYANCDIMYARRSLPLPFIQGFSNVSEETMFFVSDISEEDL